MNIEYRWFLGYLLTKETPHFSTLRYNFKHRYTSEIIEKIFYWILNEINSAGYLSPETVFVDGTHIKANANIKKVVKKEISKAAKIYKKPLSDEINEDREEHGKKPFDDKKTPENKIVNESTTDPESGVFHKGEHKKCLAYTAQTACNENYHNELVNDLISVVENKYSTYAESTAPKDLISSRNHRAFGEFSMGSVATWRTFQHCLDHSSKFLIISYGTTLDDEDIWKAAMAKKYCSPHVFQSDNTSVPVLIWELDERDLPTLNRYEGYPNFYR